MKNAMLILTLLWTTLTWGAPNLPKLEGHQVHLQELTAADVAALPTQTVSGLQQAAYDLAQIWADTILEGDYWAEDNVRLDKIETIDLDGALVAYRITYSSKAKNTFTNEDGRIIERGFVSIDFKNSSRDTEALASFKR